MVVAIFGESCTGKSTLARALAKERGMRVYSGRDYLKLAKSESEAAARFRDILGDPAQNTVYVITDSEHMRLLPEGCVRVLTTASLQTVQSRFAARTGGRLPPPVAAMLERRHGVFDREPRDLHIDSDALSVAEACAAVLGYLSEHAI